MTDIMHMTFRIYKLPNKGGYVLAELTECGDGGMDQDMRQAKGDIDQIIGSIGRAVTDWDVQTDRLVQAQFEDANPNVVKMEPKRRFWPSLLARAGGGE